ncbi:MAG: riboflavin synthase [bacterium]
MFTGIIEEIGIIKFIERKRHGAVISVNCAKVLNDLNIGDSIAIDGACQTVSEFGNNYFSIEASQETLNLTTLKNFQPGFKVNLERAMPVNGRFGGHIVTGHVDGVGTFEKKINQGLADLYYFSAPENIAKYMVYKGSVCINGISLTVASLKKNIFSVSVIPMTAKSTNLTYLKAGDNVNLESDILAKYIEKFVSKDNNVTGSIDIGYLEKHGFIQ